jgi:hypothetical protein
MSGWRKNLNGRHLGACMLAGAIGIVAMVLQPAAAGEAAAPSATAARDGQHDFDFNVGVWKTHIKRILDPLSGSANSIELNGTVTVRKVWNGRAQLEEIEAEGPDGHWEGLTLFLYNPQSHQWSQTFANSKSGVLITPLIGAFKEGSGELFSQDTVDGRSILVRAVWSDITANTHHFEESYSDDGGKTWAPAFIASLIREQQVPPPPADAAQHTVRDKQRDFDFDFGTWTTHTSRLVHPLTGSHQWIEMHGVTEVRPVWGGLGNIAELESDGPTGHLELLSLRLYDPRAHQWNLNFATSNVGVGSVPMIGKFRNGRGVFYDQETYDGRSIWVRFTMIPISANAARSEQAFSDDGGKTWETNWINRYSRAAR